MDLRKKIYEIIFEAETKAGKIFDIALLIFIVLSVLTITAESIETIGQRFKTIFVIAEWFFTILFTIEYVLRIYSVQKPLKYMTSFFGLVDFLAIIPTYMEILIPGSHFASSIRILRLLRIFRILKMQQYTNHGKILYTAIKSSKYKITVFLFAVTNIVIVVGALMYAVEGKANGFTSIPKSIYWAIVTLTTVGYGDISPSTPFGQFLASIVMITGYGIIAVPTGIVTFELNKAQKEITSEACPSCGRDGHDKDAQFCKYCGGKL